MSGDAFGILIGAALLLGGLPIILGTAAVGMAAATVLRLGAEAVGEGVRRHRQSQLGHTRLTVEQQRVRQPVGVNHPPDLPDSLLIA